MLEGSRIQSGENDCNTMAILHLFFLSISLSSLFLSLFPQKTRTILITGLFMTALLERLGIPDV